MLKGNIVKCESVHSTPSIFHSPIPLGAFRAGAAGRQGNVKLKCKMRPKELIGVFTYHCFFVTIIMSKTIILEGETGEQTGFAMRLFSVLSRQLSQLRASKLTTTLLTLIAASTLIEGYRADHIGKSVAYLLAMWLCTIVVDMYVLWYPPQYKIEVRKPKREGLYVIICLLLGFLFFYIRYFSPIPWMEMPGIVRILTIPLLAFIYPIALAIIFLSLRYKLPELGLRFKDTLVALPIIAIVSCTALLVAPDDITISEVINEAGGIPMAIFQGFILAALSEELWRIIVQTRLGGLFGDRGLGWIIATIIWAFMHLPSRLGMIHTVSDAYFGFISIAPIGLMWGYMTHRTKSIIPSIVAHGTNVWGLQNI
jgi:membrane protease YdiL (CAAX protease family)